MSDGQVTAAILDNTPLRGEEEDMSLFPETSFDTDHLSTRRARVNRQDQEEEGRQHMRERRRRAFLDQFVLFITRHHLLPKSWLHTSAESGERYPAFICSIRDNSKRWGASVATAIGVVASMIYIMQFLLGAPSAVMHDGTNVINLWAPSVIYQYDLASESASMWLEEHRGKVTELRQRDLRSGHFEAIIYSPNERRNVTFNWLIDSLNTAYKRDCSSGDDKCACAPAVEIGVLANVARVGNVTMFNPRITQRSDRYIPVAYNDGTTASQPIAVVVEYLHRDGKIEKKTVKLHAAACLVRVLDLLKLG